MAFKETLAIANLTCTFGSDKVLLDYFFEIFYPAIFESSPRSYDKTTYYLFDLSLSDLKNNTGYEPVLSGRFVKDSEMQRDYVLRNQALVENSSKMEFASSARFVLVLSTHTLLYVKETANAPSINAFRSTLLYHLKNSWMKYINNESARLRKIKNKRTDPKIQEIKKKLIESIPMPELRIVELPNPESIKSFLAKFEKIDSVVYKIHDTNHSSDFKPLINKLRSEKKATGASQLSIVEKNPTKKTELTKQIDDSTKAGNVDVVVSGTAKTGEKIIGTNDEFKMIVKMPGLPKKMSEFTEKIYSKFNELVSQNKIKVLTVTSEIRNKLQAISDSIL